MAKKKEVKVKTKDQKKYNLFKINLIILIVLLVLVLYFFLHVKPTILGNAGGVIGVDFSAPIAAFQLDKTSMTFAALSETQTLLVSTNDSKVYKNAYYSTGTTWNKFQLSGTTLSSGWITGAASKTLSLKASDLNLNDTNLSKTLHIITYSCTKISRNKFDCRNNLWQLKDINVTYTGTPTQAATPVASPGAGTYTSIQSVTLTSTTSGASIYYTTNGSTPTTSSTLYSSAISISTTTTLKAIATKSGYTNSSVLSVIYTINAGAANTYYISTTGTDGSTVTGDIAHPWKTLAYACSRVTTSGSTIHVNAGTYNETAISYLAVGVSIIGEGNTSIIKSFVTAPDNSKISVITLSSNSNTDGNQSISYLKIDGGYNGSNSSTCGHRGIYVQYRSNVKIHHCTFVDLYRNAVFFYGTNTAYNVLNYNFSTGNEIHDCVITNCTDQSQTSINYIAAILAIGQDGLWVYNNTLYSNSRPQGHNGNIFAPEHFKNMKYYNNVSYKPDYDGGGGGSGAWNFHLEMWNTYGGNEIYNNEFHGGDQSLDVGGFVAVKGASDYSYSIHDNLFTTVAGHGVGTSHTKTPIVVECFVTEDLLIYNNRFLNMPSPIAISSNVAASFLSTYHFEDVHNPGNDLTTSTLSRIKIYNNLLENNGQDWASDLYTSLDVMSIEAGGITTIDDVKIFNNTVYTDPNAILINYMGSLGITINSSNGHISNVQIKNNIFCNHYYEGKGHIAIKSDGSSSVITNVDIENNLFYNIGTRRPVLVTSLTNGGSLTYTLLNNKPSTAANITPTSGQQQNPLFISTTGTTDFHLQSGSPAIDTGINVGLSYNGAAPDIGRFESNYSTGDLSAPTITSFVIPATNTSLSVPITTFVATDNTAVTGYKLTETSTAPSASASGWSATAPTTYAFTNTGEKTLYAWAKDAAGNVSLSSNSKVMVAYHFYYIAPNGNDNSGNGTINSPWYTLDKALSIPVIPGDMVYLRGGTYNYTTTTKQTIDSINGTSNNYVMIWAYPNETPVFDYTNATYQNIYHYYPVGLMLENSNYVHVKGLQITNIIQSAWNTTEWPYSTDMVIQGFQIRYSSNNIVENCTANNLGGNGFKIVGDTSSNNNTLLNCDSYNNFDPYTHPAYDFTNGFLVGGNSTGTVLKGCRSWLNSDDGYDFYDNSGTLTIDNCWSFWNGYLDGMISTGPDGDGDGYKLGPSITDLTALNMTITNSLAFENRQVGFQRNAAKHAYIFYNNTAYKNLLGGVELGYAGTTNIVKNNIAYANSNYNAFISDASTATNNTFLKGFNLSNSAYTVTNEDFMSISSIGMDGPRKADGSLPDTNFLHLATGSDLINAGTPVGLPYNGGAPDLGAFETQ